MANKLGILIAVILGIFSVSLWAANHREKMCEQKCLEKGYAMHAYKGFSGVGIHGTLNADSCTCANQHGARLVISGADLW